MRDGSEEYDFKYAELIKEGGQAKVMKIRHKFDDKIYAAKKLKYQIGKSL